jgi:hypothetical protein
MTTTEILIRLEEILGFDPEDSNLMVEGRKDNARLSISHKAAELILTRLENTNA